MHMSAVIRNSQYLIDGVIRRRRHVHAFTYEKFSVSDRWRCQTTSTFMYMLSLIRNPQYLPDGVTQQSAFKCVYFLQDETH